MTNVCGGRPVSQMNQKCDGRTDEHTDGRTNVGCGRPEDKSIRCYDIQSCVPKDQHVNG